MNDGTAAKPAGAPAVHDGTDVGPAGATAVARLPRRPLPVRGVLAPTLPVALGLVDAFLVHGVRPGLGLWTSLASALVLPLRRRCPEVALVVTLLGMYIGYIWFAPMIALCTLAARRAGTALVVAGAAALALVHYLPYPLGDYTPTADRQSLLDLLDSCVLGAGAAVFGRWARARTQLRERVRDLTESRHREAELRAERAVTTERARLAREMHDVVAHQVSLISLQAGALQMTCGDDASRERAGTVRDLAAKTLEELRHMVGALRSGGGTGAGLAPQPRLADLPRLAAESGLRVALDLDGALGGDATFGGDNAAARGWPEAVERAAYRTVQEALTNVRKHAPGADVRVTVDVTDNRTAGEWLTVDVRNGPAAAPGESALPEGGHGLLGLRERALLLGGTFAAHPTGDGGFAVSAGFPTGRG
ncbi:histidine kinase [Streptomyces sp. NPDC000151]|uniref:sensor histidine kinase n=1 Tax=Streptomyces sp. NPDC000151 TaxID=3154244 RepID=UPI003326E02B